MPPTGNIQLGRLGHLFVMAESAYGVAPTITAAQALRHIEVELSFDPYKFTDAPDRFRDPSLRRRTPHEAVAGFDLKKALLWPSGTIGTAPEADALLLAGLGAKRQAALTTTIASAPSTTGATLTASTGLQAGDWLLINVAGDKRRSVKTLTVNAGTHAVTWAQTLPMAPTAGDTVKSGTDYNLASELSSSVYAAHYLLNNAVGFTRECLGIALDELTFTFEQAQEPMFTAKGPAAYVNRSSVQAEPGSFTTVGTVMPTGMLAFLYVGMTAYPIKKLVLTQKNNEVVRMGEIGHDRATDYYRQKQRAVSVAIDAYVENPTPLYAASETKTPVSLWLQCGSTEGQIWACYMPSVLVDVPTTPDADTELTWSFKGSVLGVNGNDEFSLTNL